MAFLQLKEVHKRFGSLVVLDGVTLDFVQGETTVVLGPSGTGKSVLLKHIVGLLKPDSGDVIYHYRPQQVVNISKLNDFDLARVRKDFGFCFQMGALFDSMTAGANVEFPLHEDGRKNAAEVREIAQHKLMMVGLPDAYGKMPAQLSGGQRKRVALARAIALSPRVVLYDEPTTGLDPVTADVINEVVLKLQRELRVTSIVVTHDMVSTFKVADRIIMLRKGKVIADGSPREIRLSRDERVRRFIEGRAEQEDLAALKVVRETGLVRSWAVADQAMLPANRRSEARRTRPPPAANANPPAAGGTSPTTGASPEAVPPPADGAKPPDASG